MSRFRWALAPLLALSGTALADPLPAEEMQAADADYQRYCALCHGADRAGHANDHAPSLKSKSLLESGYPTVLAEAIAYGRPGTPMGGYLDEIGGPLDRAGVRRLVEWLVQVEGKVPQPMGFVPVAGDIDRGRETYAAECADCHGADGEGGTGTALANAGMLALTPDGFLRHAIVHGREGTPMPAFAGNLSDAEIDGVTAFLRSRAGDGRVAAVELAAPPPIGEWILNPDAPPPQFELTDGRYVSAAQLDRELRAGRRMVLLDTRVTSMWQLGHIAGAAPLPYYSSPTEVIAGLPRDGTWIVAYCECPRAAADSVVRRLRDQGFTNTAVLYEGIQGWVALGYPVVGGRAE